MNNEKNTKDELLTKLDEMRRRMAQLERDLSECRRTQENQPQGEGEFRRLLGEISEGTAIVVDGKNRWVNKAFGDVFGYAGEELTGKRVDFLLAPEELPHSLEHMNATLAGRDVPSHYETLAVRRDGQVINIDVSAKAVSFEGKKALQIVVRDITQHKQAEKLIRHRLEFERLISSISTRFINVTDFDESMNSSLAEIGSFSKVSRAYLFVIRDDGHTIDNTHEWCAEGVSPEIHNLQNMDLDNSPWWMSQLGKGETLPIDVSTLPPEAKPEREALEAQGIKSLLVLSLTLFGKLTGYIGFDSVAEARQWNDDDVLLLRMYSGVVGNALERKRVWAELQRREQHFRSLIEKSSDAVVIIGGDGVIRYESPSYEHMLGYRPGERAQGHFLERINPEDATKATDSFTRQLANPRDTAQIEMRVRNRDGDWRVIEATSTNLLSDPAVGGLVINMHDITER
ncbi:MAG: PAS domain S-box protein, partial [Chloroflexi bacterium]|nr:PAS domain S-box protein [Chloroflexota bacterium]